MGYYSTFSPQILLTKAIYRKYTLSTITTYRCKRCIHQEQAAPQEDEIANIKQLNKDLLLFNATNSTQLRIMMKAGAKPGTTDYEIVAYEPQRDTWTIFKDSAGNYASGEYRTGLFFNTNSLSGNCDSFSLGTVLSEGTEAASAYYSRNLGPGGTKLNLLYSTNAVKVT